MGNTFLKVDKTTTLSQLSDRIGSRNVDRVLHANQLERTPDIGRAFIEKCRKDIISIQEPVDWQRKSSILNKFTSDSDVFETAALLGSSEWKLLSSAGTFFSYLIIPESVALVKSADMLGNAINVRDRVYDLAMKGLSIPPHYIDPSIFNEYSTIKPVQFANPTLLSGKGFAEFPLPWGDISLYSSLAGYAMDIPAYPEELSDAVKANYIQMPDLIYQYEPWQLYSSSGPRTGSYTFNLHRDMWNGDHTQGGANQLIRFCEANCYPEYNGSAVNTAVVSLYIKGQTLISGVLTDVEVNWDGPLGHDGWYLHFTITLTITEVSPQPLSYNVVRTKPLIG